MNTRLDLPDKQVSESNSPSAFHGHPHGELVVLHRNPNVQIDAQGLPLVRGKAGALAGKMSIAELLALEVQTQADEDSRQVFGTLDGTHTCEEPSL